MKRIFGINASVAGLLCLLAPWVQGASLVISPAAITNDFRGTVTITVSGLTAGQSVTVEQYLDANGNGQIDSGTELLMRSFSVTDGRVTTVGGVRNLNVPGDEDGATNGQIRIDLPYPGLNETLTRIAGSYLFRLADPLGVFAPVTNAFSLAQKVSPQGVAGKATAAGTGLPLANAVVVMVPQNGSGFGTVADAGGNFTLYGPSGDYFLLAAHAGSVGDQGLGGVTISPGVMTAKNLTNLVADQTISGKVSDSGTGTGLPGVFVQCETDAGLFALAFTDAAGDFLLPATADQWKVKMDSDSGLVQLGYLAQKARQNVDTAGGSVSNVDFQFSKPTALIYGKIRDNQSNSVAGLGIYGNDASYTYDAYGVSDAQGNYAVGVFASTWNIGPDNQALAANNLIGQGTNVTVADGQAVRADFTVQHVSTHLRGIVVNDAGAPLGNLMLMVQVFTTQGPSSTSLSPFTQGDGTFDVGVSAGHWNVSVECSSAAALGLVGPTLDLTVVDGVDQSNIVLIAQSATSFINGVVRSKSGTPLSEQIYAFATLNGTNYNICGGNSDAGGNYQLAVFDGLWQVGVSGDLTSQGYDNPQGTRVRVSGNSNIIANITVYPVGQTPPVLFSFGAGGGQFQLRVNGSSNQRYRVERTTNLGDAGSWVPLRTNTATGGFFDFTDTNSPAQPSRFYRALLMP